MSIFAAPTAKGGCAAFREESLIGERSYQWWYKLPDSPVITEDFPFQTVDYKIVSSSAVVTLICSKSPMYYLNVGNIVAPIDPSATMTIYRQISGNWVYQATVNSYTISLLFNRVECQTNHDIYSDAEMTTIFKARNTADYKKQLWRNYPHTPAPYRGMSNFGEYQAIINVPYRGIYLLSASRPIFRNRQWTGTAWEYWWTCEDSIYYMSQVMFNNVNSVWGSSWSAGDLQYDGTPIEANHDLYSGYGLHPQPNEGIYFAKTTTSEMDDGEGTLSVTKKRILEGQYNTVYKGDTRRQQWPTMGQHLEFNPPPSPFPTEQYPYQVVWYLGTDATKLCASVGYFQIRSFVMRRLRFMFTGVVYNLINGKWVFSQNASPGDEPVVSDGFPHPWTTACNADIYEPYPTVAYNKTTTMDQDNGIVKENIRVQSAFCKDISSTGHQIWSISYHWDTPALSIDYPYQCITASWLLISTNPIKVYHPGAWYTAIYITQPGSNIIIYTPTGGNEYTPGFWGVSYNGTTSGGMVQFLSGGEVYECNHDIYNDLTGGIEKAKTTTPDQDAGIRPVKRRIIL